jgi:bifunctional DNA-binding transcriptional regulator/antitoxin component of YhaV-PrlF toxin-antitoxin module
MNVVVPKAELVVPRSVRRKAGIKTGDQVEFKVFDGVINIIPKPPAPDDVLSSRESALVKKAEREMRQGKYVTLTELRHDLDRPRSRRRRKAT